MKKFLWAPLLLLTACSDAFDVHPYDVNLKGEHDINSRNIRLIEAACEQKDTLRFACISDTHGWYSDTKDEIGHLNSRNDLDFVIHLGDLTDTGTTKEYTWTRDLLSKLRVPYIALIGNHDFLGTGDQAYAYLYGKKDFSMIAARVKFVCLNTNATEYDYLAAVPNFDFMETEMSSDSARFDRTIIVMHAPPFSDQFNNNVAKAFNRYIHFFPNLLCCLYGHNHACTESDLYEDGLMFYGIDCALHRKYRVFTITPDGYEQEVVRY